MEVPDKISDKEGNLIYKKTIGNPSYITTRMGMTPEQAIKIGGKKYYPIQGISDIDQQFLDSEIYKMDKSRSFSFFLSSNKRR